MARLQEEHVQMGSFKYTNWLLFNDAGDLVAFDQDVKLVQRVLHVDPGYFQQVLNDVTAQHQKTQGHALEREDALIFTIERILQDNFGHGINDLFVE